MKLADIGGPTEGEQALFAGLSSGKTVPIGGWDVPDADASDDRVIRAEVLRAVILGQVEELPEGARMHEKGVQLANEQLHEPLAIDLPYPSNLGDVMNGSFFVS